MSEERRIVIEREDRPFWKPRYHWTVERLDGGADLIAAGRCFQAGAALREAAGKCAGIGPYSRIEALVLSKWHLSPSKPKVSSPLTPELLPDKEG